MAKISVAEKEAKQKMLDSIIVEIFFESGYESITHAEIGRRANMGRSSVQKYYYNNDFQKALLFIQNKL